MATKEEEVKEELVELEHWAKSGTVCIGENIFKIVDGIVKVPAEFASLIKDHIKVGG